MTEDADVLRAVTNAWKVLHVLGVSLAEAGRYWMVEGEESGRRAVEQIMDLPTMRSLYDAEDELHAALLLIDPSLHDELERVSEELVYWEGPDSPNSPPELDLVSKRDHEL